MADDPIKRVREADKPAAEAETLTPAAPPGDGEIDAPRLSKPPRSSGGFSDNDSAMSLLADTDDGNSDY